MNQDQLTKSLHGIVRRLDGIKTDLEKVIRSVQEPPPPPGRGWKIVRCDNYGRSGRSPGYDEVWYGTGAVYGTLEEAQKDCDELNWWEGSNGKYFYRPETENYVLEKFK